MAKSKSMSMSRKKKGVKNSREGHLFTTGLKRRKVKLRGRAGRSGGAELNWGGVFRVKV